MGISNEKHVLDSSGEIVYRDGWMSRAMSYADEHGFSVIRDMLNGEMREKDEYGVWIVQKGIARPEHPTGPPMGSTPAPLQIGRISFGPSLTRFDVPPNLYELPSGLSRSTQTPSDLLSRLLEMAANPPGFNGISTPDGVLGNRYIDLGWVAAVRTVIEMVTANKGTAR